MGAFWSTDETKPKPRGHHIGRLYIHITATVFVIWLIWKASMVVTLFTNIWTPATPEALFYMYIPTYFFSAFLFIFDSLFMSSLKRNRKEVLTSDQIWDRILRGDGSQWLYTVVFTASGFWLIFMLIFYSDHGVAPWVPLPFSTNGILTERRMIVKGFELGTLAISLAGVLIATSTSSDALKRHVSATIKTTGGTADDSSNNAFEMTEYNNHLLDY